ncbi:peptidyl-alpha-hydroxyglycine alpha-amidating lyase family protein [Fulvivirga sedimenti]|uniref:Peptidyl-alpha-hydroxyglycine alpha-amidating lyase family protein n=1 Tax=Fulvivirga sedimenti TaxID=2879465 RepID=A0A9X1HQQ1_9BACT|nr:peptidyl-alpha-hydroxyglycine alpha-amidating lyase family protein [Fulvivirga sedimenti]MCA6075023.1 peptidyl-alpha-hydroxyglycine alpha-amidating lyase family protein [Fulvivirga sedimenti]MCA6076200.1 peptidyl-alpha-hydroxyglycine alpha-amidating lyase family protein [Fulvivirga sedimenti]MCA6077328.1 peptidyl-alpha-hydroxyglycine alpha-amidating lyase family protein [Fulvivirga sedimenti]
MIKTKIKECYFILLALICFSCNEVNKSNSEDKGNSYVLVKDWPQLSQGFSFSAVSAVGVDNEQNIFMFQRTGREWTWTIPDSLISSNTIFLLEKNTGKILNSWGSHLFIMPHGLSVDNKNNVWVADVGLHQIFKFSHEGELLMKLGEAKIPGNDSLHFNLPTDVAVANDGSLYVSDGYGNSRVVKFSKEGKYLFEWGTMGNKPGEFNTPHSIDLDAQGNVFIADRENNRIQKFDPDGNFLNQWENNMATQLYSIAIDQKDNLFAIDNLTVNDTLIMGADILLFDAALNELVRFGRTDSIAAPRYHDIDIDGEGNIYVAETGGRRVRKFKKITTE